MSRKFVAGTICGLLFFAAVALADSQSTKDLIKGTKTGDEAARLRAIDTLGEEGETTPEAISALTSLLKDRSATVRAHAAHALSHFGTAARPAVESLAPLIVDPDQNVQREAIRAWTRIHPGPNVSVPILGKVLKDADPSVRAAALHLLAEAGKAAVPALIQALKNEKAGFWACLVLTEIGPDAADAVPTLIEALATNDRPEMRREATLALASIGPASVGAVPVLTGLLADPDVSVSSGAAYALGSIGPAARTSVPVLSKAAEGPDAFLQAVSVWALAKIEPQNNARKEKAVAVLTAALKSQDSRLRAVAARSLADLHPAPEAVLPAISEALEGGNRESVNDALVALASLGEAAVPAMIAALKHEELRPALASMLGHLGPPAKDAAPALVRIVKTDKNVRARCEALLALGAIGAEAPDAVAVATACLNDPHEKVCFSACYALGRIGPKAIGAKLELQKKLDEPDAFISLAAAWALSQIDPQCSQVAAKSVPLLIKGLADPEPKVRKEAAAALRNIGPLAKDAVPALKKTLNDKDELVRDTAAAALKAIGQ